jgi:hypothetical protein
LAEALAKLEAALANKPGPMPEPDSRIDAIQAGLAKVADATGQLSGKIGELERRPTPAIPDYAPKFAEIHTAIAGVATQTQTAVDGVSSKVATVEENQGKISDKIKAVVAEAVPSAASLLLPTVLTAAGISIPGAWLAIAGAKLLGGVAKRRKRRNGDSFPPQLPGAFIPAPKIMQATTQPQTQPILMPGQDRTETVYVPVPTADATEEAKRRAERTIAMGDANAAAFFSYRDKLAASQQTPNMA